MRACLSIIIALLAASCSKSEMRPADYCAWIENENNGVKTRKEIEDYTFTFFYKPLEYVALIEEPLHTRESISKRVKELQGYQYYTLKIASKTHNELLRSTASSEREYYHNLEYLVSEMQNDLALIDGKDTLPCVLYHFEQNYHLAPFNNILIAFEDPEGPASENETDKTLLYDDAILRVGPVQITIKGSAIDNIPKPKL